MVAVLGDSAFDEGEGEVAALLMPIGGHRGPGNRVGARPAGLEVTADLVALGDRQVERALTDHVTIGIGHREAGAVRRELAVEDQASPPRAGR